MSKRPKRPYPLNVLDNTAHYIDPVATQWPYPIPDNIIPAFEEALGLINERQAMAVRLKFRDQMPYSVMGAVLKTTKSNCSALVKSGQKALIRGQAFRLLRGGSKTPTDPIDYLPTSVANALKRSGIERLDQLTNRTYRQVWVLRGIGKHAMDVIINAMSEQGLTFLEEPEKTVVIGADMLINRGLSVRTANTLLRNNIRELTEMDGVPETRISELRGIGSGAMEEIKAVMSANGLALGPPEY